MKLLVLDNYDSFTYNLVYILRRNAVNFEVYRNDKISPEQASSYDGILLSPGPGIPNEAGSMPGIIEYCAGKIPILGICLGHQALAEYMGGELLNNPRVFHGVQTPIRLLSKDSSLFHNIPREILAGRYHSWEVSKTNLPADIEITAVDEQGSIMALQQRQKNLFGLQFHPESIMTPEGPTIIQNFINICNEHSL
jgi:anthranilate synthase component 2